MRKLFPVLLLVLCFGASSLLAQTETAQIAGTVIDPTGAVVPNAKVTVKSTTTGLTREVTTSSAGAYLVTNLPPSTYDVTVAASGFSTATQRVTITVGAKQGLDFHLEVGKAETVVTVSEGTTALNTETQTIAETINTQQIIELPTVTRDPYALVGTVGNVSNTDPSGRGAGFAINGQRSSGTNVMLDGTANNDEFAAVIGQHVPLDSVQEFSVLTNNFTAEYGRVSSGVVNVLTKSGTNSFHGSAYEFGRYSDLASNDFNNNANGIAKPHYTRNQFGFSAGGPIIKNKLFFFTNTEWIRVRSQAIATNYVPTPQLIAASAPGTQAFFSTYGKLRPGLVDLGTYSKAQFQGLGLNICSGLAATSSCAKLSSTLPIFDRVAFSFPADSGAGTPQNQYQTVEKIDYTLSEKTQMYVRYARSNEVDFAGSVSHSPWAGYDTPNLQINNSFVYSYTHTFTPNFISQTKVDFNRFNNLQPFGAAGGDIPTLYWNPTSGGSLLGNALAFPGYLPYTPGNGIPFGGPQNFVELYQDLSYVKGKHNFRFGGNYTYLRDNRTFGAYETAVEGLGTTTPKSMENFLNGQLYQFQAAVNPQGKFPCGATQTPDCTLTLPVGPPNFSRSNRYNDWGLYIQDAWKLTPRLTINYGLRWDVYGTQYNKNGLLDSNFYLGSGSNIFQQVGAGSVQLAPKSPIGKLWDTNYHNFAPRLGFAWDVFGDGKTSFRGGYGRGYERDFGNVTFNVIQNPPNYAVLSLFAGSDLPTIPVSVANAGPLAGNTGSKALGKVSLRAVNPNIQTAYVDFWSAALEHKFGHAIVAAAEYNGSHGGNQYGIANYNRVGAGNYYLGTPCTPGTDGDPGTCVSRLLNTQYSNINFRTNGGTSNYEALNLRLDVHDIARTGLMLRSNFTWSHAIDDLSDTFSSSGNNFNLGWLDPFNPSTDRGNAYYDIRHRFTFAGIWTEPYKGHNAFTKYVLGGWELAPILTIQSGSPYSIYDCTNGYNVCMYADFSGKVSTAGNPQPLKATSQPNQYVYLDYTNAIPASPWFNPKTGISDFGPFPSNMVGRNAFYGPGSWDIDLGIHKNFSFSETKKLQFRFEMFNMFNHPNLGIDTSNADISSSTYIPASFGGNRNIQLGLRFDF